MNPTSKFSIRESIEAFIFARAWAFVTRYAGFEEEDEPILVKTAEWDAYQHTS